MRKANILFLIIATFSLYSCRDMDNDVIDPNSTGYQYTDSTYTSQFKRVWQGINNCYVFWKWETIDWDSVYAVNLPLFEEADANYDQSKRTLSDSIYKEIWTSFIGPLKDRHFSLTLQTPHTNTIFKIKPYLIALDNRKDYHQFFSKDSHLKALNSMIASGELKAKFDTLTTVDTEGNKQYIIEGVINDHIPYLYFSSFAFNTDYASVSTFFNKWINQICRDNNLKGAILDTRNNQGGNTGWLNEIGQYFTNKTYTPEYEYIKSDMGKLNYSSPLTYPITPCTDSRRCQMSSSCPLVCLFDCNTYSCAEQVPHALSYIDGFVGIGEQTQGLMGTFYANSYTSFYSGTFGNRYLGTDQNVSTCNYYCFMTMMAHVDAKTGQCLEGIGMIPKINVPLNYDEMEGGIRDNQLLRAVEYITNGK